MTASNWIGIIAAIVILIITFIVLSFIARESEEDRKDRIAIYAKQRKEDMEREKFEKMLRIKEKELEKIKEEYNSPENVYKRKAREIDQKILDHRTKLNG